MRIAYLEPVSSESAGIDPGAVEAWLETPGFQPQRKREGCSRLQWQDVEAFLEVEEGELARIELTFTLSQHSPSRWESWTALVRQVCTDWDLSLYDSNLGFNVEAGEILRVLAGTQASRDFEGGSGGHRLRLLRNETGTYLNEIGTDMHWVRSDMARPSGSSPPATPPPQRFSAYPTRKPRPWTTWPTTKASQTASRVQPHHDVIGHALHTEGFPRRSTGRRILEAALQYLTMSGKQAVLGDWSDEQTQLGTGAQIATGSLG